MEQKMKAMIFAAGRGTRLKPLTDALPKALVPIGGKPLLYHVISKLKSAGVSELIINVHHFPDSIIRYVHDQDDFGMTVRFSDERDFLRETGGGIRYAESLLRSAEDEGRGVLVHNVDILSNLDLRWFVDHIPSDALATLVVSSRKTQRYLLFDGGMRLVGWTNIATGEVRSPYPDLDPAACMKYAFSGIHLVSEGIFSIFDADNWGDRFSIMDFYIAECAKHPIYGIAPPDLLLLDVGKPGSLREAETFLGNLST